MVDILGLNGDVSKPPFGMFGESVSSFARRVRGISNGRIVRARSRTKAER
jgi:hypothetical protein